MSPLFLPFGSSLRPAAVWAALLLAPAIPLPGQALAQTPPGGIVLDSIVSRRDSGQRYALFLPTQYDTTRRWPLLIAMDPRGRAPSPISLMRSAADRLGYLIISSYNTRSDELDDPNAAAVNAIVADALRLLPVDPRRLYFVGFSGTARAAWEYGYALKGQVAGVLGFGAGFPPGWRPPVTEEAEAPFVFFGGAGATDFNHEEMELLDPVLDSLRLRHRIEFYGGPHAWAPTDVMNEGVVWMELQAQRRGLAPVRRDWVDSVFATEVGKAARADSAGQRVEAYRLYRRVAADFRGVADVAAVDRAVLRLSTTGEVKQSLAARRKRLARYGEYMNNLRNVMSAWRTATPPPTSERLIKSLSIRRLQAEAADSSDQERALAASRLLEEIFALASFYEPRWATGIGAPDRALVLLEVAEAIHPGRGSVCRRRQEVLGRLGRLDTTGANCPE